MPESTKEPQQFGINSWLEEELYQKYLHDRKYVDESWKDVFESNGKRPIQCSNGAPVPLNPRALRLLQTEISKRHFQRRPGAAAATVFEANRAASSRLDRMTN